jgi:hypothetical protein
LSLLIKTEKLKGLCPEIHKTQNKSYQVICYPLRY